MSQRPRERPREQDEHRQPDELNPAWDLDRRPARRRQRVHRRDRTARTRALRPVAGAAPGGRGAVVCRSEVGYRPGHGVGPTPRGRASACAQATPRAAGRAASSSPESLSAVLLLVLLLSAFGSGARSPPRRSRSRRRPSCPAASRSTRSSRRPACCSLQLPVAQSAVTAIGYRQAAEGRAHARPGRTPGQRGPADAALAPDRGRQRAGARLVPAERAAPAPARRRSSSAPRRAPTSTRRSTAPSSGSRTTSSRTDVRRPHRHPAAVGAVRRRLAHAPAPGPVADRRLGGRAAGARRSASCSTSRRSSARRSRGTPRTPATTSRSKSAPPRHCPSGRSGPPLKILFVGDVVGAPGPQGGRGPAAATCGEELGVGFCIMNGENAADGIGITPKLAERLLAAGADVITLGNHTWRRAEIKPLPRRLGARDPAGELLGLGSRPRAGRSVPAADGTPVAVINVLGSLFLEPAISMFELIDDLVESGARVGRDRRRGRARRGDEREGRALALARRPRHRRPRHAHARADLRRPRSARAARPRSPTPA